MHLNVYTVNKDAHKKSSRMNVFLIWSHGFYSNCSTSVNIPIKCPHQVFVRFTNLIILFLLVSVRLLLLFLLLAIRSENRPVIKNDYKKKHTLYGLIGTWFIHFLLCILQYFGQIGGVWQLLNAVQAPQIRHTHGYRIGMIFTISLLVNDLYILNKNARIVLV